MALPSKVDEITPAWLTHALRSGGADVEVAALDVTEVAASSTTKIFVRASYAADLDDNDAPSAELVVKGVFDAMPIPEVTALAQLEVSFYTNLAPQLSIPSLRCRYAGSDEGQGIVIFDNASKVGTRFSEVADSWTPDQVARALEVQAAWHAATWNTPRDRFSWLVSGNQVLRGFMGIFLREPHWSTHLADPDTAQLPAEMQDPQRVRRVVNAMWRFGSEQTQCLSHGDPHIGNTFIDRTGSPGFYDWQTFCLAPSLDDVCYFMTGALTIEDRRINERELVNVYLEALTGHGGPRIAFDDAWKSYRIHQAHGFAWALIPGSYQPVEASVPMAKRHLAAILDHDTLSVLESL
jgi:hypothetical protein